MAIKSEAISSYFSNEPDQAALANKLNECFDITFGKKHGDLAMWLAYPHTHCSERFGITKEILVIYCPHDRVDARVLTAIENITRSPDFKHRVDKIFILLIHNDKSTNPDDLIKDQNDWLIISINKDELITNSEAMFIRKKISEAAGSVDLFGISSPIKHDKYFYGRDELVTSITRRAVSKKENSGLFGLRKTGKTSVLFAIERRTIDDGALCVYLDWALLHKS